MKRLSIFLVGLLLFVAAHGSAKSFVAPFIIIKSITEKKNPLEVIEEETGSTANKANAVVRTATITNPLVYVIDVAKGKSLDQAYRDRLDDLKDDLLTLVSPADIPAKAYLLRAQIDIAHEILSDDAANIFALTQSPRMLTERLKQLPKAHVEYMMSIFEDLENVQNYPGILLAIDLYASIEYFEHDARPIPQPIRGYLACYFSNAALERARYVINDDPTTLNGTINWLRMTIGDSKIDNHAVVSGNIIVFAREPASDESDFLFWAHEVAHAVQYEEWGIVGFSRRYMADHRKVENSADKEAEAAYRKFVDGGKMSCQ